MRPFVKNIARKSIQPIVNFSSTIVQKGSVSCLTTTLSISHHLVTKLVDPVHKI